MSKALHVAKMPRVTVNGIALDANQAISGVGSVKTVNGISPDGAGNITVGSVKTVNGALPDAAGDINVAAGSIRSTAMAAGDTTNKGSFECRSTGTGDANLAGMSFQNDNYGIKMGVRADGYFGIGGWSRAAWSWYTDPNGNMVSAGNVTAYSDPRLKENFTKFSNPLELVSYLDGGTFRWRQGISHTSVKAGKLDYGLMADQVEKALPLAVIPSIEINGQVYRTVDYAKVIPLLVECVKELTVMNKKQELRIAELEKKCK